MSDIQVVDRHRVMDLIAETMSEMVAEDPDYAFDVICNGFPGVDNMGDYELLDELETLQIIDEAIDLGIVQVIGS